MKTLLFLFFLLLMSCENSPKTLGKTPFVVTPILEEVGDGTFFSQISSISTNGTDFFLADFNQGRVLRYDSHFRFLNSIGSPGQGPNEFSGLYYIFASKEGLHGFDGTLKVMKEFDFLGNLKNTTSFPSLSILSSFCFIDNHYFFAPFDGGGKTSIQRYSSDGEMKDEKSISLEGDWPTKYDLSPIEIQNKNYLLALDAANGKVSLLDSSNLEVMYTESLVTTPSVMKTYDALKKRQKHKAQNHVISMFNGICTEKNKAYVFGFNTDENYILDLVFSPKGISLVRVLSSIDKEDIFPMAFSSLDGHIYIFNFRSFSMDLVKTVEPNKTPSQKP